MRTALLLALAACGPKDETMTRAELLDPESCADCHPDHYREWSGSMHAYAAQDPVFRAMNARGQRETGGELGDFCVQCHAPMAVREGATTDGTNLDEVPQHLQGVTCAFCHQVTGGHGDSNNPLELARDKVLRGPIADPVDPGVHVAEYSPLHDRDDPRSAELCGPCHDIVAPSGAHIERTYAEWKESIYALESSTSALTCGDCHMRGRDGVVADFDGVPLRRVHDHSFPGVDTALDPFPEAEAQEAAVQAFLDSSVRTSLCVGESNGSTAIVVTLENVAAGHAFPSGASADRRVWLELDASLEGAPIWSKGVVADDQPVTEAAAADPTMATFHDTLLDAEGMPTHMFWEAASYETNLLPPPSGVDLTGTNHIQEQFLIVGQVADSVSIRVKLRPIPLDLVDDLVATGDLDPAIRALVPTRTLRGSQLTWTPDATTVSGNLTCVP